MGLNVKRGVGFARPKEGQLDESDLFFHAENCITPIEEMWLGQAVAYDVKEDKRNGKAMVTKVKVLKGRNPYGSGSDSCSGNLPSRGRSRSRGRGRHAIAVADAAGWSSEEISRHVCKFGRYAQMRPRGLRVDGHSMLLNDIVRCWGVKRQFYRQR